MLAKETKFLKNEHQGGENNRKMSIMDDQWWIGPKAKALTGSPLKSLLKSSHHPCACSQILWVCSVKISGPYLENWIGTSHFCQGNQFLKK